MKYFFVFFLAVGIVSCNREGLGGDNTVVVTPKTKGRALKGATVYVRFGSKDFPGSSPTDYDTNAKADSVSTAVTFKGLRKGDYFIYATAFDSVNASIVQGGKTIHLSSKSGETDTDVELSQ